MSKLIKMTDAEYFAADAMNASSLKWYKKGALHYEIMKQLKRDKKTKSLSFGDAGHKLLLEPEKFDDIYAVKPDGMNLGSKDGREWKAKNGHKTILSPSDWEKLEFYNAYWNLHPWSKQGNMNEVVIFAEVEGVLCKIKIDKVDPSIDFLLDIKTTRDTTVEAFLKGNFVEYDYDVQIGLYTLVYEAHFGRKISDMKFFCLPKEAGSEPYAISMEFYIEKCQESVKYLLSLHKEASVFSRETCVVAQMPEWLENKIFNARIIGE